MVSHTGSGLPLFLLCCLGALPSSHMVPIPDRYLESIIKELQFLAEKLLKTHNETGLPPFQHLNFSPYCQTPRTINSTALWSYLKAVQPLLNDTRVDVVLEQLEKLKSGPDADVPVPTGSFDCKTFKVAVLEEFVKCMKSLSLKRTASDS